MERAVVWLAPDSETGDTDEADEVDLVDLLVELLLALLSADEVCACGDEATNEFPVHFYESGAASMRQLDRLLRVRCR